MSTLKQVLRQDFTLYVRPHFEKSECEVCGSEIEHLHVHHVTHFQDLLNETLEQLHLEYYEDIDVYTEDELQLIRDVMLAKQMRIEYITCCQLCHLDLHDGSYRPTTKTKEQLEVERKEKEERQKRREEKQEERLERKRQQELKEKQKLQEQEIIHSNILQKLQVGMKYKYQQLCDALGFKPATGNTKKKHMTTFEQYLKLEKQGTWFLVVEIYDEVQRRNDKRKDNGKSEACIETEEERACLEELIENYMIDLEWEMWARQNGRYNEDDYDEDDEDDMDC